MARTKELSYTRTFSLGAFEGEKLGITVELDENERAAEVIGKLKAFIHSQRSPIPAAPQQGPARVRKPLLSTED